MKAAHFVHFVRETSSSIALLNHTNDTFITTTITLCIGSPSPTLD
jgi:hypothetical protein